MELSIEPFSLTMPGVGSFSPLSLSPLRYPFTPQEAYDQAADAFDCAKYIDQLLERLAHEPDVHNQLLDTLTEYKFCIINTSSFIRRTLQNLRCYPALIEDINPILPIGYRLCVSQLSFNLGEYKVKVNTPAGSYIVVQAKDTWTDDGHFGGLHRQLRRLSRPPMDPRGTKRRRDSLDNDLSERPMQRMRMMAPSL
ncbi:hypothetical protein H1R20_g788, partial [Candolleomyces eurysporus]